MKTMIMLLILLFVQCTLYAQTKGKEISHYLFPEFVQGTVLMKNGQKNPAKLNYNAASEEMVFMQNDKVLALAEPSLSQLDSVFLYDRKFVLHNKKFVEVLHRDGFTLLASYKCKVIPPGKPAAYGGTSQTSAADSYSSWSSGGRVYELQLPDDFQVKPYTIYFLDNGSGLKEFKSMRQLKSHYKKDKKRVDQYLKEQKVDFEDTGAMTQMIYTLETETN